MLAAVAAVGVYLYQSSAEEKDPTLASLTVPPTPTSIPTVGVLVANQDIGVNTTITDGMVEIKQILPDDKNIRALSSPEEAVGKVTTAAIVQGEQVLSGRLSDDPASGQDVTFAYNVPEGKRAFSVIFSEVIGAGGLVQPGDHVDVIGFFEVEVYVPEEEFRSEAVSLGAGEESSDEDTSSDEEEDIKLIKLTQYVTAYIVQNVEVLAVSQALSPEDAGLEEDEKEPTPTPTASAEADSTAVATAEPVARPEALTVTLAVDADQAQRLLLASQTVTEDNEHRGLRLALRTPGDTTVNTLPPAQTGPFSLDQALGDLDEPFLPSDLMITNAVFERKVLSSGEVLEFTVTVKNTSATRTIKTDKTTPPEYLYNEGEAFDTLGFFAERGTYRLGLNVSGAYPTQYPYRWGLGRDLKPGEEIDIAGSVKLTEITPATRFWFGVIREPDVVSQDGVSVTDITVLPAAAAVVTNDAAQLRKEPTADGLVTKELTKDDYLTVLETQDDWFRVEGPGGSEGWIEVSAVQVVPPDSNDATDTSEQTNLFD
jgi:Flp pilus assembly protein CpaB